MGIGRIKPESTSYPDLMTISDSYIESLIRQRENTTLDENSSGINEENTTTTTTNGEPTHPVPDLLTYLLMSTEQILLNLRSLLSLQASQLSDMQKQQALSGLEAMKTGIEVSIGVLKDAKEP